MKKIKMAMLGNGRITIGYNDDDKFDAHIEILCSKYNTNIVAVRSFTPEQYENKKANCSDGGVVRYEKLMWA